MSNANITKDAIASAMKELMETKPFESITVGDIVCQSGISRKTFYYHFKDKYDLVNWIFSTALMDKILKSCTLDDWPEGSLKLCRYIWDNKSFYTNAVNYNGQNCFVSFLYHLTEKQITLLCKEACTKKKLSSGDVQFLIDFYYHAFIGVFTAWVENDFKDTPEVIVQRWVSIVDKSLENYINTIGE
jgi:probable dihydroxyacetone kinase regulator